MISPELLRRYPFFGFMGDTQLKAIAMIAEESTYEKGQTIFDANQAANTLYFLEDGSASNYFVVKDNDKPIKELYIGDINPGDIFGISALIEPYIYTAAMRAEKTCRVIKIEASALRALCEVDLKLSCGLQRAVAKATMERLHSTRVQLVAATH
jgi:CRP-like cAMP-binding protein